MMIYEAIGYLWVIFTSMLGTIGLLWFAWRGISRAAAQMLRGEVEANLDIQRQAEIQMVERMTR